MVKVKIIKAKYESEEQYVGGVYEAFVMKGYDGVISNYAAQVDNHYVYTFTPDQCEVVVEGMAVEKEKPENSQSLKVLLVEDGSVDTDDVGEWCADNNIKMIVYRNGATKPEFQKIKQGE